MNATDQKNLSAIIATFGTNPFRWRPTIRGADLSHLSGRLGLSITPARFYRLEKTGAIVKTGADLGMIYRVA